MIDRKWFIRVECLRGLQVGKWEVPCSKNSLGYSVIIKGKVGRGGGLLCLSWAEVMLSSTVPPPGWAEAFSCPYMSRLGPQIIVYPVCREHVPGIINLLSSLGRMWVSPLCCLGSCLMLPLHGFVAKQACSLEPSFNLQGVSHTFSTYRPLMGLTNHLRCPFTLSLSVIQQIFSAVPCYKRPDA